MLILLQNNLDYNSLFSAKTVRAEVLDQTTSGRLLLPGPGIFRMSLEMTFRSQVVARVNLVPCFSSCHFVSKLTKEFHSKPLES